MAGRKNFPNRQKERAESALERQAAHNKLTTDQKLSKNVVSMGARERTRLAIKLMQEIQK
jgi:hypothetical protein